MPPQAHISTEHNIFFFLLFFLFFLYLTCEKFVDCVAKLCRYFFSLLAYGVFFPSPTSFIK